MKHYWKSKHGRERLSKDDGSRGWTAHLPYVSGRFLQSRRQPVIVTVIERFTIIKRLRMKVRPTNKNLLY